MYARETHAHEVIAEEPEMKSVIKDEHLKELEDIIKEVGNYLVQARVMDIAGVSSTAFF